MQTKKKKKKKKKKEENKIRWHSGLFIAHSKNYTAKMIASFVKLLAFKNIFISKAYCLNLLFNPQMYMPISISGFFWGWDAYGIWKFPS